MTRKYNSKYLKFKDNNKKNFWLSFSLVFISFFLLYCFLRPSDTGILGKSINSGLSLATGVNRFFIPFLIFFGTWFFSKNDKNQNLSINILILFLSYLLLNGISSVFIDVFKLYEFNKGWLGVAVNDVFSRLMGKLFGIVFQIALFLYLVSLLFKISISDIFIFAYSSIINDVRLWIKEISKRKETKKVFDKNKSNRYIRPSLITENKFAQNHKVDEELPLFKKNVSAKNIITQPKVSDNNNIVEEKMNNYVLPNIDLLTKDSKDNNKILFDASTHAKLLENVLKDFDINSRVVNITQGPVVTLFEIELQPGVKVQSVLSLKDNIALAMKTSSIRIIAPFADRGTIGIEIPNSKVKLVRLRDIFESENYNNIKKNMKLPIAIGKTIDGESYVADISTMPHLLVAGATGSGKSVCIHSIIMSLLYHCAPSELKFLLIDPKRLELTTYNGIPHIYDPYQEPQNAKVITSTKEAAKSLSGLVKIMEQRYEQFAHCGVRNIEGYNDLMHKRNEQKAYYIVVIIDEFADLILTVPREVEDAIQRLAQMARAVGIHLVVATQRPSVDVITGVIKANFSARIAFQVLSKTDSRVILDTVGAEDLLGRGDMLFLPQGAPKPVRLQGAFITENEVKNVVDFIKKQGIQPEYQSILKQNFVDMPKEEKQKQELFNALKLIKERKRVSQDLLRAHFGSSSKATDILSLLEVKGYVYKPEGTNRWTINFDKIEEEIKNYNTIS